MMQQFWYKFKTCSYKKHLLAAFIIRLMFIVYSCYHDQNSVVQYTDVDYKVFTDASRHVLKGNSPYDRHTYRYSPLIAIFLIPNIILHVTFGKILFSIIDILVAVLIKLIIENNIKKYQVYKKNITQIDFQAILNISIFAWLYNPMSIAIATRGNCDSIAGFLVLSCLYFLQCRKQYFTSGLLYGLAIHFRLYPIIYSLALYMCLSKFSIYNPTGHVKTLQNDNVKKTIFKKQYLLYLVPNLNQIKLIIGCLLPLIILTSVFYYLYGFKFLYETYLYHVSREDVRHNFSLYFYLQYITYGIKNLGMWQKVLVTLPKIILMLVISVRYGLNQFTINFSILLLTIVFVTYNTVLTSQYFIWILVVLPLSLWQLRIDIKNSFLLLLIWFIAQFAWLLPAYLLEFRGHNTFMFIWIQSVSFFCANVAILGKLVKNFIYDEKIKE